MTEFTKSRLFATKYTLGERQINVIDVSVVAQRKVTMIPFSDVSSFPFIVLYFADARGKWDEAAEHTYCKLRASGNLLVSTPPSPPKPTKGHFSFLTQSVSQHIYTLNTKTRLLHKNSEQQKIKEDGRKIHSSLFLVAEEHD